MVESTLRNVNEYDRETGRHLNGRNVPIKLVTASRGKDIRAEPVVTLYKNGSFIVRTLRPQKTKCVLLLMQTITKVQIWLMLWFGP